MNLPRVKVVERHYWALEIENEFRIEDWYKTFDNEAAAYEEAKKLVNKDLAILR